MSIRSFKNMPCDSCGKDTMHKHYTCLTCGANNAPKTPGRDAITAKVKERNKRGGPGAGAVWLRRVSGATKIAAEKRRQYAALPEGAFGKHAR